MGHSSGEVVVSICCIAYNHEAYIRNALDGFIMQKTTFPIEVLIHDDASTDGTSNIIKEYEEKHPGLIFPIYQKENQYSKGLNVTLVYNWSRARGKYLAQCEGDDYWTDPYKLQKQVDFMEANPEYIASGHESTTIYNNGDRRYKQFYLNKTKKDELCTKDFLTSIPFHTSSLVFNRHIFDFSNFNDSNLQRDHPLMIMLSTQGKIKHFKESMSVYRKNASGVSENINCHEVFKANLDTIDALQKNLHNFFFKALYMKGHWYKYYLVKNKELNFSRKIYFYLKYFFYSFYIFPKNIRNNISIFLAVFVKPIIYGKAYVK